MSFSYPRFLLPHNLKNYVRFYFLQYLNQAIMRNRNKLDWSKPFKFIESKKAFEQLDTNEESLIIVINTQEQKPPPVPKKQDILVPKIDTVKRVSEVKKFAKLTPNYIRLPSHLNLPLANQYQLTQVDHIFLKSHQDRFVFKGKKIFNQEFLRKVIVELEMKAGKDMTLPRNKGWIMAFFEKEYKDILQMEGIEQFADIVYNYWKNRREELRFPLLRLLWKPNADEYNHMLAFRPRERQKRSLRRTNRIVEDEIIEQLYQQFDIALKLVDRAQLRQQLKLKQVQLQIASFYNDCRTFITQPEGFDEIKLQQRVKDKERIKNFQGDIENFRSRKESLENVTVQDNVVDDIDQKQTIVNFLSTVIYEAQQLGISYEKIYYPNNSLVQQKIKNFVPPTAYQAYTEQLAPKKQAVQQKSSENLINISLHRFNDLIIRRFEEDEEPIYHVKPCKDFLQYKRRNVDQYYFGSDDEGELKDLKKNITTSFKRFLQMQQLTRTISATSEN